MSTLQSKDLDRWFGNTVAQVKRTSDTFEKEYVRPALKHTQYHASKRPLLSTFVFIFAVLSLLPISIFLFLSLCVLGGSLFLAFAFVASTTLAFLVLAGPILLLVLLSLAALSLYFSSLAVGLYAVIRLQRQIKAEGSIRAGGEAWVEEIKAALLRAPIAEKIPSEVPEKENGDISIKGE